MALQEREEAVGTCGRYLPQCGARGGRRQLVTVCVVTALQAVASGAIASDYQRTRVERVCARLGLVSLAYLWQQPQVPLLQRMVRRWQGAGAAGA